MPLPTTDNDMHPLLRKLLGGAEPAVMGILNITPELVYRRRQFHCPR